MLKNIWEIENNPIFASGDSLLQQAQNEVGEKQQFVIHQMNNQYPQEEFKHEQQQFENKNDKTAMRYNMAVGESKESMMGYMKSGSYMFSDN